MDEMKYFLLLRTILFIRGVLPVAVVSASVNSATFYETCICDMDARIALGCSKQIATKYRGNLKWCAINCLKDDSCQGASIDEDGMCFLHSTCNSLPVCKSPTTTNHRYTSKFCPNCQISNPLSFPCTSWNELATKNYVKSCKDLHSAGYPEGVLRVFLDPEEDGIDPYPITCFVRANFAETSIMRNKGEEDMNKTWADYRRGFYIDDYHYFAGLDTIQSLLNIHYPAILVIDVRWSHNDFPTWSSFEALILSDHTHEFEVSYSQFRNGDGSPVGNFYLENCFEPMMRFSTWDYDNDADPNNNCADITGSGWWFNNCGQPEDIICNPFGRSVNYKGVLPPESIMKMAGMDFDVENSFFESVHMSIHY